MAMTTDKNHQRSVTIGYRRDDGDFRVLATLSNIDEELPADIFNDAVGAVRDLLHTRLNEANIEDNDKIEIEILERQDAPDYIELEEGE